MRKIFDLYISGNGKESLGIKGIARHLNEKGILWRGKRWSKSTVIQVLSNRACMGEHIFNRKEHKTGKIKDKSEWIVVPVAPIVDKETFEECSRLREMRSPVNMPPRLVNSPTLLTGLLRCGSCGNVMTLATGKGGRYRYYKCTRRINEGAGACDSANIPMERLDTLILEALAERVFTPSRVEAIMHELKKLLEREGASEKRELSSMKGNLKEVEQSLERLYEAVEKGFLPLDISLKERAQRHKARREEILVEMGRLRGKKEMPLRALSRKNLQSFCRALKEKLKDRTVSLGKDYLRLLVDEIRIEGKEVSIKGGYGAIGVLAANKKGRQKRGQVCS